MGRTGIWWSRLLMRVVGTLLGLSLLTAAVVSLWAALAAAPSDTSEPAAPPPAGSPSRTPVDGQARVATLEAGFRAWVTATSPALEAIFQEEIEMRRRVDATQTVVMGTRLARGYAEATRMTRDLALGTPLPLKPTPVPFPSQPPQPPVDSPIRPPSQPLVGYKPFRAVNLWGGHVGTVYYSVYAGGEFTTGPVTGDHFSNFTPRGAVLVNQLNARTANVEASTYYPTPRQDGPVRLIAVSADRRSFTLEVMRTGATLIFDLTTRTFIDGSATGVTKPAPTAPGAPTPTPRAP